VVLVAVMVLGVMAPAMATKPGTSDEATVAGHKVTICHATNSASNPFVVITIDVAAWEPGAEFVRHGAEHHQNSKTGHVDAVYDEETGCDEVTEPPCDTSTEPEEPTGPTNT
jgi:hypothetical protein